MIYYLQQLVNGLAVGSTYALIALGYTMVFGVLRLINFAHGDVFMVGAFAGAYVTRAIHRHMGITDDQVPQSIWIALVSIAGAMLVCGLLGYTIERFCYRPLRKSSRLSALITAIGVSLFLEYLLQIDFHVGGLRYFGATDTNHPQIAGFTAAIGWIDAATGLKINGMDLLTYAVTAACMAGLMTLVLYTRTGRAMRAVSVSYDAARLMGVDVNRIISLTFVLGSVLAGVAGVMYGMRYGSITPLMGVMPGLKAFIAAVIGGIGNIPGAVLGGLLLGVVEGLIGAVNPNWTPYTDAVAFMILILMLLVRPEGILGKAAPEKV